MLNKLKSWWAGKHPCIPEKDKKALPWYRWKKKHSWEGCYNKHGVMYRRRCTKCNYYEDRRNKKWVGYAGFKWRPYSSEEQNGRF